MPEFACCLCITKNVWPKETEGKREKESQGQRAEANIYTLSRKQLVGILFFCTRHRQTILSWQCGAEMELEFNLSREVSILLR